MQDPTHRTLRSSSPPMGRYFQSPYFFVRDWRMAICVLRTELTLLGQLSLLSPSLPGSAIFVCAFNFGCLIYFPRCFPSLLPPSLHACCRRPRDCGPTAKGCERDDPPCVLDALLLPGGGTTWLRRELPPWTATT